MSLSLYLPVVVFLVPSHCICLPASSSISVCLSNLSVFECLSLYFPASLPPCISLYVPVYLHLPVCLSLSSCSCCLCLTLHRLLSSSVSIYLNLSPSPCTRLISPSTRRRRPHYSSIVPMNGVELAREHAPIFTHDSRTLFSTLCLTVYGRARSRACNLDSPFYSVLPQVCAVATLIWIYYDGPRETISQLGHVQRDRSDRDRIRHVWMQQLVKTRVPPRREHGQLLMVGANLMAQAKLD